MAQNWLILHVWFIQERINGVSRSKIESCYLIHIAFNYLKATSQTWLFGGSCN